MPRRKLTRTRTSDSSGTRSEPSEEGARSIELREEQLVARKETQVLGTVEVRTEVEHVPGRLEVDAYSEEVEVEHEPVGEVVTERVSPWKEDDGALVVPVYEEQLVVSTQLVLRERIRIRTVAMHERRLFEETLRRERLVVEDPDHTGRVRELYPDGAPPSTETSESDKHEKESGILVDLVRKALE